MSFINIFKFGGGEDDVGGVSEKDLIKWVETLPLLNRCKSIVLIKQKLIQLDAASLSDSDVIKRLSILYDVMERLCKACINDFVEKPNPVLNKATLFSVRELFYKYSSILVKIIDSPRKRKLSNECKISLLNHSLGAKLLCQLTTYQLALVIPEEFWSELYMLYGHLLEVKKSRKPSGQDSQRHRAHSPEKFFKMAIILGISNPYQLNAKQLMELYTASITYADKVQITSSVKDSDTFVFVQHSNNPPQYQQLAAADGSDCVGVSTKPFLDALNTNDVLDAPLCALLNKTLSSVGSRQSRRQGADKEISIISGLMALHRAPKKQDKDAFSMHSLDLRLLQLDADTKNQSKFEKEILEQYNCLLFLEKNHGVQKDVYGSWTQIDESEGGMKLSSKTNLPAKVMKVNGLIGIKSDHIDKQWSSGIVRWVNVEPLEKIEMGFNYSPSKISPSLFKMRIKTNKAIIALLCSVKGPMIRCRTQC